MTDYVFAYGSLVNSHSRSLTVDRSGVVPVVVRGWLRSWTSRHFDEHLTYVGVQPEPESCVNGVLLESSFDELERMARRERYYSLARVEPGSVQHDHTEHLDISDRIWIWKSDAVDAADERYPVSQCYIDTCLTGCIECGGTEFARQFVQFTAGWDSVIAPDRAEPRYPRHAPTTESEHHAVDQILRSERRGSS